MLRSRPSGPSCPYFEVLMDGRQPTRAAAMKRAFTMSRRRRFGPAVIFGRIVARPPFQIVLSSLLIVLKELHNEGMGSVEITGAADLPSDFSSAVGNRRHFFVECRHRRHRHV